MSDQDDVFANLERRSAPPLEVRDLEALTREIQTLQRMIRSAFPDGDLEAHRRYHEETIDTMRDLRDMMRKARNNAVSGLVWMVLVFVGLSVWSYTKSKLGVPE